MIEFDEILEPNIRLGQVFPPENIINVPSIIENIKDPDEPSEDPFQAEEPDDEP